MGGVQTCALPICWNPGDEREYFTRDELVEVFVLSRVQKGSALFDEVKLFSVNQHWMRTLSDDDFLANPNADTSGLVKKVVPLLKERARTFGEAREMLSGELSCFFKEPKLDKKQLLAKDPLERPGIALMALKGLLETIKALPEEVTAGATKEALMPLADAEEAGRGAVLWPLRYALSGQERSPDPFTLISILGPREATSRVERAIDILQ